MPHLFAHPERLWWLLGLLPMALWAALGARRRSRDWAAIGQSGRPPGVGSRGWVVAMGLLVLALAQPRWGRVLGSDAPSGHDVVLLVDVSRSMAAEDAVPDRLGVAIESATGLLDAIRGGEGNRVAVVAFAGRGVVRCPLTSSLDAALDVLRSLRPGDVRPGGTDLGAALDVALGAFDEEEHAEGRTVVVFSDGEDHVGSWESAIDRLRADAVIVHCVAIGDPERGHPVPAQGRPKPGKAGEAPAETRRSDVAFRAVSKATGGVVVPLGLASADLGTLFRDRIEPTARQKREELRLPERVERFPAFVLAAVGFGLAGSWPGLARRRGGRLAFSSLALAIGLAGAGPAAGSAAGLVARGRDLYSAGKFDAALAAFDRAIGLDPDSPIPRFNSGSALFQLRRHAEALARYEQARQRGDVGMSIKVDYAVGNTLLALGEVPGAIARYDACVASTLPGSAFDAIRADALANREFATAHLKPPTAPTEGENPDPNVPKRPGRSPKKSSKGGENGDPSEPGSPASPRDGAAGKAASDAGSRGAGGAGGSGQVPPQAGSPESRLDEALKDIKEARRRRPPDAPPPPPNGSGKDW